MLLFIHTLIVLCADLAFYCKNSMGAAKKKFQVEKNWICLRQGALVLQIKILLEAKRGYDGTVFA